MRTDRKASEMKVARFIAVLLTCISAIGIAAAQTKKLTAAEAKVHIGERATVCGKVASSHYAVRSKGQPTFLNLDEPYPKQIFIVVIWGDDRSKLGDVETKFNNARVCVTGQITSYRGSPEIVAKEPEQIEVQK
jgi:DNA/RNA endonuclease YhcR with UshA esterase domain